MTTVASKHLAKTFDAEGVVIAEESDEAEDDWDAVDNLDDLVKISGKIQANHELQEEAEQMAMEEGRQEPNIKDKPIRSAEHLSPIRCPRHQLMARWMTRSSKRLSCTGSPGSSKQRGL